MRAHYKVRCLDVTGYNPNGYHACMMSVLRAFSSQLCVSRCVKYILNWLIELFADHERASLRCTST